jgi:predicted ABC-type exoprotein transport system permease subunit
VTAAVREHWWRLLLLLLLLLLLPLFSHCRQLCWGRWAAAGGLLLLLLLLPTCLGHVGQRRRSK